MWRSKRKERQEKYELMRLMLEDAIDARRRAELHRLTFYERHVDSRMENARLRDALEQIAGATMSHYASVDDMARGIKRIAKEALLNGEKSP